jgi:hypothetical protein
MISNDTGNFLSLYPQDKGDHLFYIEGASVTGVTANKRFNYSVECGMESKFISLTDNETLVLDHARNEGIVEILNSQATQYLFTREEPTRCPIETYIIYTDDEVEVTINHPLWA